MAISDLREVARWAAEVISSVMICRWDLERDFFAQPERKKQIANDKQMRARKPAKGKSKFRGNRSGEKRPRDGNTTC